MADSKVPSALGRNPNTPSPRTPGPLGKNDAADPNLKIAAGDTPGPLGVNDHATPRMGGATATQTTKTKSGSYWVTWANAHAKFSESTDDLIDPFKTNAKAFIKALEGAGATVTVGETKRSDKRAYLFHWCWLIGLGKANPSEATNMAGVEIEWDHGNEKDSRDGAKKMINGFKLAVPPNSTNAPALKSNHIAGKAIDMRITWKGSIKIKKKEGTEVSVDFMDDVNKNTKLHDIGASYGVKKLTTDAPHWSVDGH